VSLRSAVHRLGALAWVPPFVLTCIPACREDRKIDPSSLRAQEAIDTPALRSRDAASGEDPIRVKADAAPLLALDTRLLELDLPFGQERDADVRLIGVHAGTARVEIKDAGEVGFTLDPLPRRGAQAEGFRVHFRGTRVGVHVGNIVFTTDLPEPTELTLPYTCKVRGTLDVRPTNPYFDLRGPGPSEVVIDVRSTRSDFAIRAAEIAGGPFTASYRRDPAGSGYEVTVGVREDRLARGARGTLGKLILRTNDASEPEKEIPLFAFGSPTQAP
jgi:hypothetical protein